MTHPLQLHATAALWSLHTARTALTTAAEHEAAQIAAELLEAADGIQGWRPVIGRGSGGHGDPAAGAALFGVNRTPAINRAAILASRTTETLTWLANQLHAPAATDPLARLTALDLTPRTAAALTPWLVELDTRIRQALGIEPESRQLVGVECPNPRCGQRLMQVQTAGPRDAWTVVCPVCLCIGAGCGCGMPGAVEGVAHIWPRSAVIGAVAGAAPDQAA